MKRLVEPVVCALAMLAMPAGVAPAQKPDFLSEEEVDKLREAQEPSARIELYLAFTQARLERFENLRSKPADLKDDNGATLNSLLDQVVNLNDELKTWIDDQFERNGDMRRGLHALLGRGPSLLENLRRIEQSPGPYASAYRDTLRDAIDDLTDTLDGGTKALADQEKKFAELKREEKTEAHATKERRKEEEKRNKEEKKLRKRQHKRPVPEED